MDILNQARAFLFSTLKDKPNSLETIHPWRKGWQFTALHSLRVESYALKILDLDGHHLTDREIILLRMAAILHDIARSGKREDHATLGAEIARAWLQENAMSELGEKEINCVVKMIGEHSNKTAQETDFSLAVLKDADTLDEIGALSIFMASNWLDKESPFFFHQLKQRLIDREIPFCEQKRALLNTNGARAILEGKKAFIEKFIAQFGDEIEIDPQIAFMVMQTPSAPVSGL